MTDKEEEVPAPRLNICRSDSMKHSCPTEQITQMAEEMKLKY